MLLLLAGLADNKDYEPPSVRVADMLDDLQAAPRARDPIARRAQVEAFLFAAGGA